MIFFKSNILKATLEKRGIKPLLDLIERMGGWKLIKPIQDESNENWQIRLANIISEFGQDIIISIGVNPDANDTQNHILYVSFCSLQDLILIRIFNSFLDRSTGVESRP